MTTTTRAEGAPGRARRSPVATAARWATGLALAVAVVGVVLLSVGTFTDWLSIQTVPTGSMEPAIHEGSVIVVDPVAVDDVAVGDVIVFAAPETGRMTVHRVATVELGPDGRPVFTTKGDANEGPDPWHLTVEGDHLHRVRYAVPVAGRVLLSLSSPGTRLALAGVGAALVLGFGLAHLWRRPERRVDPQAPALDSWIEPLHRLVEPDPVPRSDPEAASVADAVDQAHDRRRADLADLVLAADPPAEPDLRAPTTGPAPVGAGHRIRRRHLGVGVVVALMAATLSLPARSADASFTGTTAASGPVGSLAVPAKGSVGCSWSSATATTVSWSNPNATDTTRVLVASSPGGATTVGATAAAGATSVAYAPTTPLTTVRYLSVAAVDGTWTSDPSPELPTSGCRGAVTVLAGSGTNGLSGDGGPATAAALDTPLDTAEAPDGRIFVADSGNDRIRVVSPAGTITTFAGGTGTASPCTYAGAVSALRLTAPRGVAVDGSGNVYIADTGAGCIRRVDPTGTVSRVAGGGATTACTTTTATAVSLSSPSGLAIEPSGDLLVADTGRNCVRRISGATVSAVAGGGTTTGCTSTTASAVSLSGPLDVDVDAAGAVYVADTGRNCARKVVGTAVTVVAGGGATTSCTASVAGTAVSLSGPQGIAVDAGGTVYVADTGRRCVRRVVAGTAAPTAFTGTNSSTGDNGPALGATARTPSLLSVLGDGDLLVADRATNAGANDVRRIELS